MTLNNILKEIKDNSDKSRAKVLSSFFKTGKGQYGEGDIFLGLTLPQSRSIAKKYLSLSLNDIDKLISSKIHEERLIALLILVYKFEKDNNERRSIFDFYIKNSKKINNWDLVDVSAHHIVGRFILDNEENNSNLGSLLLKLAESENLWEKRISIVSTYYFIKNNRLDKTLEISKKLLNDKHDLIHKAVGWMLREVGKKNILVLKKFLRENYSNLPRTTLRYAIERFPEKERKSFLKGEI